MYGPCCNVAQIMKTLCVCLCVGGLLVCLELHTEVIERVCLSLALASEEVYTQYENMLIELCLCSLLHM